MNTLGRVTLLTRGPLQSEVDQDGLIVNDGLFWIRTSEVPGPKTE